MRKDAEPTAELIEGAAFDELRSWVGEVLARGVLSQADHRFLRTRVLGRTAADAEVLLAIVRRTHAR